MQATGAPVDKVRDIGLVLSGGGAKGAYQAGVWKALVEGGVADRIAVISGTSVGAINAAAFAAVWNPNRIRDIWHNHVASIVSPHFKAFSPLKVLESVARWADGEAFPMQGFLDRDKVAEVLSKALPRMWPKGTPAVHATSLEVRGAAFGELDRTSYRKVRFRIDEEANTEKRRDMILASSAIPWCYSPVEIDGRRYVDGGWDEMGGENTPVQPILKEHSGIHTIVVVRCNSRDIDPETIRLPRQSSVNLVEIRPEKPLPGLFDLENLGGGLLLGSLFPGVPSIFPVSIAAMSLAGLFTSRRAKIWGATLAFAPAFTDQYFATGYQDGRRAVKEGFKE